MLEPTGHGQSLLPGLDPLFGRPLWLAWPSAVEGNPANLANLISNSGV